MGKIASNTVQGLRLAAHDEVLVEHLFLGYLRRKISRREPDNSISIMGERDRLRDKTKRLVRDLPPSSGVCVERVLAGFLDNISYHRARLLASRETRLPPWGEMFARHIDASFDGDEIRLSTEAFLYSVIDLTLDATRNLARLQGFGASLVRGVAVHKEVVQDCVVAHDFLARVEELIAAKRAVAAGTPGGDDAAALGLAYEARIHGLVNAPAKKR